ncbi:inorganic pyrophosphatase [Candidatus Saccharibacteria bacterium]|nr:MAG: inorganic pyrophosphatase [Candidatus Saccharibacteria bacterium]
MAELSYGEKAPDVINVVIEIQRGQRNKYELDKKTGLLFLDRVTPVTMGYPADYGYVPDTLCEDGDPLDALLVIDESVVHGAVVPARPIGVLRMVDAGEGDEKLICVAEDDLTKKHINDLSDLGPDFTKIVEHYYMHYKDWKNDWAGAEVSFNGWGDASEARQIILDSIERARG